MPARAVALSPRQCAGTTTAGKRCTRRTKGDHCHTHDPGVTHHHDLPSLTAAVAPVRMDGTAWQTWRPGSRAWQTEAWRLYDVIGQLRFVANWVGNSVSRCRLYVAAVDEAGEAAAEAENPRIAALSGGPLGSGPAKDEALRLAAVNLFVPGEAYMVAESQGNDDGTDRWFVVSARKISRNGDRIIIRRPLLHGGGDLMFREGEDLLIAAWTPHPEDPDEPDSPTRSAIPDLRELEALKKREFAELDSRLTGAGLLMLPDGVEFPRGPDDPPGLDGWQAFLQRAMATSLSDRASAEAMVPISIKVPAEAVDKIKHLTFWSELSAQLLPLKESAVRSLAQSLDIPPEVLLGMGDANHWTGWLISEDAVSTQIVPVLQRIADALTTGYLRAALEEIGEDPDGYVFAFDTAPLTTRQNRAADALNYHDKLLLSDEAAVEAGAFRTDQMPDDTERVRRLVERAVVASPALLGNATIAALVGVELPPSPPNSSTGQPAIGGGGEGGPPTEVETPEPRSIPERPQEAPSTSSAALVAVSGQAMRRALGLAGGRLVPHTQRDRWPGQPRYQLHTCVGPIAEDRAAAVLRGAWEDLPAAAADLGVDPTQLERLLHGFAVDLLTRGMAYDPDLLRDLARTALNGRATAGAMP